jgi:hypothetical protein
LTQIINRDGRDLVRLEDHLGPIQIVGGPTNDKLLISPNYIESPDNDPAITFTQLVSGRQRAGFWKFNDRQGRVDFASVERFNFLDKVVRTVGRPGSGNMGIAVESSAIQDEYKNLVTNFASSPIQPITFDARLLSSDFFFQGTWDTDQDGRLSPLDALVVINYLNRMGSGEDGGYIASYDVDRDGWVAPLDALIVINMINQSPQPLTMGGTLQHTKSDLNNDGVEEILLTGTVNNLPVLAVLNGVTGSLFTPPRYLSDVANVFATFVTTADLDGDGIQELITSSERGPATYTIWSYRNGQLVRLADREVSIAPGYIGGLRVAAGDINGDGKDEIVIGSGSGADSVVRSYDASGRLLTTYVIPSSFGRGGIQPRIGDFNGDGLADLFVASARRGQSQVAVFAGQANVPSTVEVGYLITDTFTDPSAIAPIDIALSDSDGDELDELYVWQLADGRNSDVRKWKYDEAVDAFFREF